MDKNLTFQHLKSDSGRMPMSDDLTYGEIAIGYKKDQEAIYIKNNEDEIVSFLSANAFIKNFLIFNNHEYVDLNLPSGKLWATVNVGAEKESDIGNYYAWGALQGHPRSDFNSTASSLYSMSWDNYKFNNTTSATGFTKYCIHSNLGVQDGLTQLEHYDDAGVLDFGGKWRIPTVEEWTELMDNCDHKPETVDEQSGQILTSNINGKTIFLPHIIPINGRGPALTSSYGYYWTADLNTSNSAQANCFVVFGTDLGIRQRDRNQGLGIRCIMDPIKL